MQKQRTGSRLAGVEWEAIAGVIAAVAALVLHLLHVVEQDVLLTVIMVVLALLMIRDLRRERQGEQVRAWLEQADGQLGKLRAAVEAPEAVLIKPPQLRAETERFARRSRGEMTWFNVCLLMFVPQDLFDRLLRPAVENPAVASIQFVLDESERLRWERDVRPKITACRGSEKVHEPLWCELRESVSFILTSTEPHDEDEAHLSFWGEPFMAHSTRSVPRYLFHVQAGSELLTRLRELERSYRLGQPDATLPPEER